MTAPRLAQTIAVFSLLLTLPTVSLSEPIPYSFGLIADTSSSFQALGPFISLNNAGTVAFKADLRTGGTRIYAASGGSLTTIASPVGPASAFGGTSINDQGTVAFRSTTAGNGVFAGNGGPLTTIALGSLLSFPSINNQEIVAYGTGDAIFVGKGGTPITIASQGGDPIINDLGTVAFVTGLTGGGQGLVTGNGGPLTLIADSSGPFLAFSVFPVINDAGTVAFEAALNSGIRGIFTVSNGVFTTLADTSGPFSEFSFLSINNAGVVAFQARLDSGGEGIFTGSDPVSDRVIALGDSLFGSTVTELAFFREGLNDLNELAFHATLADGRQVIVRAEPAPTPVQALISRVQEISPNRLQNSLISKLEAAQRSLLRGNRNAATGQLNAFINEVQALKRTDRLGVSTADSLIAQARAIINRVFNL